MATKQIRFDGKNANGEPASVLVDVVDGKLASMLTGADGNPLSSYLNIATGEYVLNIHDADVHTRVINKDMHRHVGVSTTITANTAAGTTYQIEVADATGFVVGDPIHINTTTVETTHPRIRAITAATGPATFTLDRRLDYAHFIGDEVKKSVINMKTAVGTMADPIEYWVGPELGEVWHITRLLFEMTHSTAGDMGKFGDLAPLANGVLLRARINGQYGTFTNWKTNAEIKSDMYDVDFNVRAGGGGTFGTSGRGTFTNAGAIVRLDGNTTDRIELYVQDDLTGLLTFTMKMQGHFE